MEEVGNVVKGVPEKNRIAICFAKVAVVAVLSTKCIPTNRHTLHGRLRYVHGTSSGTLDVWLYGLQAILQLLRYF